MRPPCELQKSGTPHDETGEDGAKNRKTGNPAEDIRARFCLCEAMKSQAREGTRARRHIGEVVTEAEMRRLVDKVFGYLHSFSREYSRSVSVAEERRVELVAMAAHRMLAAGLLCVVKYQPQHFEALKTATLAYLRKSIENGSAEYIVGKSRGPKKFWEWLAAPEIAAAHDEIGRRLKQAWSDRPKVPSLPDRDAAAELFIFKVGRDGRNYARNLLHQAKTRDRVAAIQQASLEVMRTQISDSTARRWLKERKTVARLSHKIIANALKRTPRNIQDLIRQGREQNRFADDLRRRDD